MLRVLLVCSQNRLRTPTAENGFASNPAIECASAGTNNDAENPLTNQLVEREEVVVVIEKQHRVNVSKTLSEHSGGKRIACLDIPYNLDFMQAELVALLEARAARFL